jgi:hypothetical protein
MPPIQGNERQPVGRRRGSDPQVVAGNRPAERLRCRTDPAVFESDGPTEFDHTEVVDLEREHLGCAPR